MKQIAIILPQGKTKVEVQIHKKNIKTVRLKVHADGNVILSVPRNISDQWIKKWLEGKNRWIEQKLNLAKTKEAVKPSYEMLDNNIIKVFSGLYKLKIMESAEKNTYFQQDTIIIRSPYNYKENGLRRQLDDFLKQQLQNQIQIYYKRYQTVLTAYGETKPDVKIRKMKTMWGNCRKPSAVITFNFYLVHKPVSFIEYVVLHEMLHMIHPNHSKDFYDLLSIYMPDWKTRRKQGR